ncbi:MAG: 50S ribosomal protein L29 [Helicobacteraceae bacterium]
MKYTELKDKDVKDLVSLLKEKRMQLFTLKIKQKTMQLQNTSELRSIKKDLARISTALTSKRIADGK